MFFQTIIFSFVLLNILIRFSSIFYYPPYNMVIGGLLSAVVSASIIVILYPGFLRFYLCAFGFSFFLFGFGSIDLQSRIFEVIVSCVAATVFFVNLKTGTTNRVNKHLFSILLCYVGLSTFSMLLLPLTQILKDCSFFGLPDAFFYFFIGPPYTFYYPVVSLFRLLLFVVLIYQLAVFHTGTPGNRGLKRS